MAIKLQFSEPHRSILSLPETDFESDFVVLTGKNGSGKTHLLEAIENGAVKVQGISTGADQIRLFHHSTMAPKNASVGDTAKLWKERKKLWREAERQFKTAKDQMRKTLLQLEIPPESLVDVAKTASWQVEDFRRFFDEDVKAQNAFEQFQLQVKQSTSAAFASWKRNKNRVGLVSRILATESWMNLTEERFDELIPAVWTPTDVFQHSFGALFASYYRLREQNLINQYYSNERGIDRPWVDEETFVQNHGPEPWELVNQILAEANLPLKVNHPTGPFDDTFTLKLSHTIADCEVEYSDLSAGEKVVMSLCNCLYYAEADSDSLRLPRLLLLDEPDAPLHPSMTRDFINVVRRVLVEGQGIKVIMTTHSPSTVASSPCSAVYRMDQVPRQIRKSNQASAISVLTDGFLAVTDNTHFIITEAAFDEAAYQSIFNSLVGMQFLEVPCNLVFLRASDERDESGGGKGQVISWAEKLHETGIPNFRGLIDGDRNNKESNVVKKLDRYAIENFLLDPILIFARLVESNRHSEISHSLPFEDCNIHKLNQLTDAELSEIAIRVVEKIESIRPELKCDNTFRIEYVNGRSISVPDWLKVERGKDLLSFAKAAFNTKNETPIISSNLSPLSQMLAIKLPGFIPVSLRDAFLVLASTDPNE